MVWSIRAPKREEQELCQPDDFHGQKSNPHPFVPKTLTIQHKQERFANACWQSQNPSFPIFCSL